jgi:hypothetical protein
MMRKRAYGKLFADTEVRSRVELCISEIDLCSLGKKIIFINYSRAIFFFRIYLVGKHLSKHIMLVYVARDYFP